MLGFLSRFLQKQKPLRVYQDDLKTVLNYHTRLQRRALPTDEGCSLGEVRPAFSSRKPPVDWNVPVRPRKLHYKREK